MSNSKEFSKKALENIGYYVYIYSDPDTKQPFYIGKGKGNRCFDHLNYTNESEKVAKIKEILDAGKRPIIEVLVHGIDEETALKVEAAAIDLIGIDNLTNIQKGHHSGVYGRVDVDELNSRYNKELLLESDITENVMLIRINKAYHYGMTPFEIYDNTRCCWKVNKDQADKVEYALSVYDGMVLEVFKIVEWLPAHSTLKNETTLEAIPERDEGRYEFVGNIAEDEIRKKYVGKMVTEIFPHGNQNPIKYVWGKQL